MGTPRGSPPARFQPPVRPSPPPRLGAKRLGHRTAVATVVTVLVSTAPIPVLGQATEVACAKCHGDRELLAANVDSAARVADLFMPDSVIPDGVHRNLRCAECHVGYDAGYPHQATAVAVPCQSCHDAVGARWSASIHASNERGDAATCIDCHGSHEVYAADDSRSPTYALNVARTCGSCHADPHIVDVYFTAPGDTIARTAVAQYYETVHGTAVTRAGLTVAATCNDCHRAHDILPADSAASSVNRAHITETCGSCHAGIVETYSASAHGEALASGRVTSDGKEAPVCIDCHSAHGIVRADEPKWFVDVVEECGQCHERLYETYFETYHGKVTQLGFGLTAKCSDCHTAHAMRPATDPASSVYPLNLVHTCRRCHPAANEKFVRYYPHGDPGQRTRYPVLYWTRLAMTGLLAGVFAFFGLHTVLWLGRVAVERHRGAGAHGAPGGSP